MANFRKDKEKNKNKNKNRNKAPEQEEVFRVRTPKDREVIGLTEQRLGGSRMRVRCLDGKTRVCRIPGRLKRSLWIREGDILLVEPWEYEPETKGDILFKYRPNQIEWLRRKGYLKDLEEAEF
ncbi:translation initiation factor eIF-1A [archaeon]|jgi:translation initiation factor 1A|nr:translation initiation factor eIF-1A [archaeon]|tara:strand:- start:11267 stop:11635 length:369 start_codon:yes stop_codon:yes gene_type:complete